ncbi:MAG: serine hydrolase [Propionibacteriaceae bacterium]
MYGAIERIVDQADGEWHVAARLSGRTLYTRDAGSRVPAASTIKVAILLSALQSVSAGRVHLEQPVRLPAERVGGSGVLRLLTETDVVSLRDLLMLMIVVSDNTATNAVIGLVGLEEVNATLSAVGADETVLGRLMMDTEGAASGRDNLTSAGDQVLLVESLIGQGRTLPEPLTDVARVILREQQFGAGIPALLPTSQTVLHKTGELDGICHDVGAVELPDGGELVLAILGTGVASTDRHSASDTIARITRTIVSGCLP